MHCTEKSTTLSTASGLFFKVIYVFLHIFQIGLLLLLFQCASFLDNLYYAASIGRHVAAAAQVSEMISVKRTARTTSATRT